MVRLAASAGGSRPSRPDWAWTMSPLAAHWVSPIPQWAGGSHSPYNAAWNGSSPVSRRAVAHMPAVLAAKFQSPGRRADTLLRARLVDALRVHRDRRLLLVVAPAGFGKTTLLADYAGDAASVVCWLNLDEGDADLTDFVQVVVQAIGRRLPGFGRNTLDALNRAVEPERRITALARTLAVEVEEQAVERLLLVLDDYHEVNDSEPVTRFLGDLLRFLPDNLRIAIGTRAFPKLPLSRLAVTGQVFGLGQDDLRFSAEELMSLLRLHNRPPLTAGQAAELAAGAEGWVAGFLLSAPSLREELGGMLAVRGRDGLLYDYLASEAFDRQPRAMQRFLQASSVPETADLALCETLLGPGDWAALLDDAEGAGLFITRPHGDRGTFRYHQLFRGFLQDRLRRSNPAEHARLHRLVAGHMERQGLWRAALSHLREAGADDEAAALLARVVPELEGAGRWRVIATLVDGLAPARLAGHPSLLLAAAWAVQMGGGLARAEAIAEAARHLGETREDTGLQARALARLGLIRRMQGRLPEAVAVLESARALAPSDDELVAIVRFYLGQCLGAQGDFGEAAREFAAALEYFDQHGPAPKAADAESALAMALDRAGRLGEAVTRYESARERWAQLGLPDLESDALRALAGIHARRGDYARARAVYHEALLRARAADIPRPMRAVLAALGHLLLASGDVRAAEDAFEQGLASVRDSDDPWFEAELQDGLALATAFRGDLARAAALAQQALDLARGQNARRSEALFALTFGAIQSRAGQREAVITLQDAADTLDRTGGRREATHAQLWLAQAHHAAGAPAAARHHLRTALRMAEELESDAVFDLHARWDSSLFREAVADGIAAARLDAVLRRIAPVVARQATAGARAVAAHGLTVRGFGPGTAVFDATHEVTWSWDKARELFFLLLHGGPHGADALTAVLWPEATPGKGKSGFNAAVYRLRRFVHPDIIPRGDGVYRINEALVADYDVRAFERYLEEAAGAAEAEAVPLLEKAAGLYCGPFLEDIEAAWCETERDRLERAYVAALERLADLHAAAGRPRESITAAERLLTHDPFREDAHARIVRAYLRLGDQAGAKRQLDRCAAALRDELGVTPGPELQALRARVKM